MINLCPRWERKILRYRLKRIDIIHIPRPIPAQALGTKALSYTTYFHNTHSLF
jgi:hypothetical protein